MPALGLALGLPFGRAPAAASGPSVPQNLQSANADRRIDLTWDADSNLEYLVYANTVDVFGTASNISSLPAATTGYNYNTTDNLDPVPFAGSFSTGSKYYFWVVGGDGMGGAITGPSNSASGRAFVTLANSASATLYVPNGATLNLADLLFGSSSLPDSVNVSFGSSLYFTFGGSWYDANDESPADTVPISGQFQVTNNSGASITFWDAEP